MATLEQNVLLQGKDSSGNQRIIYPITKTENVDGLEEGYYNKSTIDTKLTTVDSAVAAAKTQADKALEAANGIEIGGRNLLRYTNQGTTRWRYSTDSGESTVEEYVTPEGIRAVKVTVTQTATSWQIAYYSIDTTALKGLKPNTHYTVSFDFLTDMSDITYINIGIKRRNTSNPLTNTASVPITKRDGETWNKVVIVLRTNDLTSEIGQQVIYLTGMNYLGFFAIKNLKLELGNRATDWTPAPEDKADADHTHDDRYYTESEINTKLTAIDGSITTALAGKADTDHTHTAYAATGHNHDDTYAAVNHTHTEYPSRSHSHDDRYYTENEVDNKLTVLESSISSHNHNDKYYTESEVDSLLGLKSDKVHYHNTYATTQALSTLKTDINNSLSEKANSDHNHDAVYASATDLHVFEVKVENEKVGKVMTKGSSVTYTDPGDDGLTVEGTVGTRAVVLCDVDGNVAIGSYSLAEGSETVAEGSYSHAEGISTVAVASASHAEGTETAAYGMYSHAEGLGTRAIGLASHAEGCRCKSNISYAHAEGVLTEASGESYGPHAEGYETYAEGEGSHAEGAGTYCEGNGTHAEGLGTQAIGMAAHAEGFNTIAQDYQHAQGTYNDTSVAPPPTEPGSSTGTAFVIGNGYGSNAKSNAFRVTYDGTPYAKSSLTTTGCDYAEMFEWADGNPNDEDRRGYFVTMDGEKILLASPGDYILGIISGQPSVIGNGDESWLGRYVFDEFGEFVYEEGEIEEEVERHVINEETGKVETVIETQKRPYRFYKENPDYDPEQKYVHRKDRSEWDAVGMLGVLSVRDDGTCEVNGYCQVAEGGFATASDTGYRVIKRVNDHIVKVIFK